MSPEKWKILGWILRIRISTKWDFNTTGALEGKINFYQ